MTSKIAKEWKITHRNYKWKKTYDFFQKKSKLIVIDEISPINRNLFKRTLYCYYIGILNVSLGVDVDKN